MWRLRQAEAPPGALAFAIHPWVMSNEKLKSTGWEPKYSSRETFEITMRAKGVLSEGPAEKPAIGTPVGVA